MVNLSTVDKNIKLHGRSTGVGNRRRRVIIGTILLYFYCIVLAGVLFAMLSAWSGKYPADQWRDNPLDLSSIVAGLTILSALYIAMEFRKGEGLTEHSRIIIQRVCVGASFLQLIAGGALQLSFSIAPEMKGYGNGVILTDLWKVVRGSLRSIPPTGWVYISICLLAAICISAFINMNQDASWKRAEIRKLRQIRKVRYEEYIEHSIMYLSLTNRVYHPRIVDPFQRVWKTAVEDILSTSPNSTLRNPKHRFALNILSTMRVMIKAILPLILVIISSKIEPFGDYWHMNIVITGSLLGVSLYFVSSSVVDIYVEYVVAPKWMRYSTLLALILYLAFCILPCLISILLVSYYIQYFGNNIMVLSLLLSPVLVMAAVSVLYIKSHIREAKEFCEYEMGRSSGAALSGPGDAEIDNGDAGPEVYIFRSGFNYVTLTGLVRAGSGKALSAVRKSILVNIVDAVTTYNSEYNSEFL